MSIVSKDVVFHVKFDLEGAKKDLEKKHLTETEHPQETMRGSPHKQSAKSRRGLNSAEQIAVVTSISKNTGDKLRAIDSRKSGDRLTVEAGKQKVLLTAKASRVMKSFITLALASGRPPNPEFIKQMMKAGKAYNVGRSLFRLKQKATNAAEAISAKSDIFGPAMYAKALGYGKSLLKFGKAVTPAIALYTLAKNSPSIVAGYAAGGLSGWGGDWAAVNLSKAKGYAQDMYLGAKGIVGRPISFLGYDNDMAKQGKKGYSAHVAGFIGGSNLGTIKYDIDQAQTRLQNAFDRCQSMQVGQSYGRAWTEYNLPGKVCDVIGSLFRKR
jgi:hypothetical protein